jgi:signal transduction histidine kinase
VTAALGGGPIPAPPGVLTALVALAGGPIPAVAAAPGVLAALAGWSLAAAALFLAAVTHARLLRAGRLAAEAAHEVRGPLAAARVGLHGLLTGDPATARRATAVAGEIVRAARALDDLVRAGLGRRPVDRFAVVDLAALLRAAQPGWAALAAAGGRRVAIDVPAGPVAVRADPDRLAQACANLVTNALEHGAGIVTVRLRAGAVCTRVEVSDAGSGLPAPVAALAAGSRANARRGHGLAVAAGIAARHGGRLASAPAAQGARLVLALPALPPGALGRAAAPAAAHGPAAPALADLRAPAATRGPAVPVPAGPRAPAGS